MTPDGGRRILLRRSDLGGSRQEESTNLLLIRRRDRCDLPTPDFSRQLQRSVCAGIHRVPLFPLYKAYELRSCRQNVSIQARIRRDRRILSTFCARGQYYGRLIARASARMTLWPLVFCGPGTWLLGPCFAPGARFRGLHDDLSCQEMDRPVESSG